MDLCLAAIIGFRSRSGPGLRGMVTVTVGLRAGSGCRADIWLCDPGTFTECPSSAAPGACSGHASPPSSWISVCLPKSAGKGGSPRSLRSGSETGPAERLALPPCCLQLPSVPSPAGPSQLLSVSSPVCRTSPIISCVEPFRLRQRCPVLDMGEADAGLTPTGEQLLSLLLRL